MTERTALVVANGLKQEQFNTAWALLAAHGFTAQQRVSGVVLMKREHDR